MTQLLSKKNGMVAVAILLIAAAVLFAARRQKTSSNEYFTAAADSGPLRNVVNATGVVQTVVTVQVGSQVSGQVDELYADYNSVVKHGQLLARLDPRNYQAQLENSQAAVASAQAHVQSSEADVKTQAANVASSKANLEAARVTRDNNLVVYKRNSDLKKEGVVSQNDFDTAKANADSSVAKYDQAAASVEQADAQARVSSAGLSQAKAQLQQAQADLNRAQLNLDYCNIYSPVDGVVISRNVDVGQTIAASLQAPTLFTIANNLMQMQVNANVDEADIGNISDQADVKFNVDAYPNDYFQGRISEIRLNPTTVQNVVTYSVIISIDNPDLKLKPGMTANIVITVDERAKVLKVSNAALRYTPPDMQRESLSDQQTVSTTGTAKTEAATSKVQEGVEPAAAPLAPGQKWNPAEKIKLVPPKRIVQRPGIVYVLNAQQQKPEARKVMLGITDGSSTEIVSGDLRQGDAVIIGDSTKAAGVPPPNGAPQFGGGGNRGN
ncbi:MAG TPA: efflux RND transporter periplasmic adaptor subunit [Terriglobia bacterium]|jgi:HlyD family secretion protein